MFLKVPTLLVLSVAFSSTNIGGAALDGNNIDGSWQVIKADLAGKPWPAQFVKITRLIVDGEKYTVMVGDAPDKGTLKFDGSSNPKRIDIIGTEGPNKGKTLLAIYERSGDTLRICYDLSGKEYPADFSSTPENKYFLVTYKQQK